VINQKTVVARIYERYHKPEYLNHDPLGWVHRFSRPEDQEIAGLLASSLAYGRVSCILSTLDNLDRIMKKGPFDFAVHTAFARKQQALSGLKHRFTTGLDLCVLLESAARAVRRYGSLGSLFSTVNSASEGMRSALGRFVESLKSMAADLPASGLDYLLPSPQKGSACKRLNMFLRWMVRPRDGIDLGLWTGISCAQLLIPVDVHIARVGAQLRLTKRATPDWAMAEEITGSLRRLSPEDPVKYDFSLCKSGMLAGVGVRV